VCLATEGVVFRFQLVIVPSGSAWPQASAQSRPSVLQWGVDASLKEVVGITERVHLWFSVDFFNVLNHANNSNPIGGDGVLSTGTSGSGARTTQLTPRLIWQKLLLKDVARSSIRAAHHRSFPCESSFSR